MITKNRFHAWISRNYFLVQSIMSLLSVLLIGLYVNILAGHIAKFPNIGLLKAVYEVGSYNNAVLIFGLISFAINAYLLTIPPAILKRIGGKIIENVLEAACNSLTHDRKDINIRAIVTILTESRKTRMTVFSYNVRPDPERAAIFPVGFGITGKAIINNRVIIGELSPDHMNKYQPKIKPLVLPELKWVLAAPIYLPEKRESGPVGVLAFDGTDPLSNTGFDSRRAKDVSQAWADVIGEILGQANILKLYHYSRKHLR